MITYMYEVVIASWHKYMYMYMYIVKVVNFHIESCISFERNCNDFIISMVDKQDWCKTQRAAMLSQARGRVESLLVKVTH